MNNKGRRKRLEVASSIGTVMNEEHPNLIEEKRSKT